MEDRGAVKTSLRKAVFLDRDGVINAMIERFGAPRSPSRVEDFEFLPGVAEAVRILRHAGYLAVVVTNQPDVARGWLKREDVDAMNDKVRRELRVDDVKVCWHDEPGDCECRKPRPGMLLEAARQHSIDLSRSWMIGDRYTDVAAGVAAGCCSILVGPGGDVQGSYPSPVARVESLLEAARWILGEDE